jgi:4-amino-4-deoxy-L-arabinose transferase-like glycosyltransferase
MKQRILSKSQSPAMIVSGYEQPSRQSRVRRTVLLAAPLIVATLLMLPAAINVRVVEYDEAIFLDVARNIQRFGLPLRSIGTAGSLYLGDTPLYPYLIAACGSACVNSPLPARLLTAISGLVCVWLTFLIGKRIRDAYSGLVAGLLLALSPFFAVYSFFVRMEVPMLCASLAGLWLLLLSERGKRQGWLWAAGCAFAVAVLLKEFALLFIACAGLYIVLVRRAEEHRAQIPWGTLTALLCPAAFGLAAWAVWGWESSPIGFISAMQRWLAAIAPGSAGEARTLISASQWGRQIASDLLGPGLLAGVLLVAALWLAGGRRRLTPEQCLLWGYLISAIALSFLTHLKELRHIIGTIPVAALVIGTGLEWRKEFSRWRLSRGLPKVLVALAAVLLLSLASPVRVPLTRPAGISDWLAPFYAQRLLRSDPFYNVLRLAGIYIRNHAPAEEELVVAHQATVVAYYADRHYNMLYTLSQEGIMQVLAHTNHLLWDDPILTRLDGEQVKEVQEYVAQHFDVEQIIQDEHRRITYYRRKN